MTRVLCDVDGVIADLMSAFITRLEYKGFKMRYEDITRFHIERSPELAELAARVDLRAELKEFLRDSDVYGCYVKEIDGAVAGVKRILDLGFEFSFVTHTMREAPTSHASKVNWLRDRFGGDVGIIDVSHVEHKIWIPASYGIDDRGDTCLNWSANGVHALPFRQPWNELPGHVTYDWKELTGFFEEIAKDE